MKESGPHLNIKTVFPGIGIYIIKMLETEYLAYLVNTMPAGALAP